MQLLGWLRPAFPTKPNHDTRGRNNGRRHKLAAPPAGSGASGPGADQSPASNGSGAGAGDGSADSTAEHEKGLKTFPGALGVAAILSSARHWGFLWKAAAVHSANIASGLGVKTLQPLHEYLQRELESTAAVQDACRQLQVEGLSGLQDLLNCIILSEHVYKIVDYSTETSVGLINDVKALFPPQLVTLQTVCWAQPHVRHRYLLGESPDAIYVSFMGTKLPRDMATNANLFQEEVVLDAAMLTGGASGHVLDSGAAAGSAAGTAAGTASRAQLAAHRGFLTRARGVPIDSLYREARARGKRLVLCGHSLGGAVASLCALQLLQHLPPNLHHTVSCYGFATPALGNEALAETVKECGWEARIRNYLSPDDPIPKLLSFRRPPSNSPADQPAASVGVAAPGDEPAIASTSPIKLAPAAAAVQTQQVEVQAGQQGNPCVPGLVAASSDGMKPAQQIEQSSNAVAATGLVGTPKRSSGTSTSSLPLTIASSSNGSSLPVTSTTSTSTTSSSSSTLPLSSNKHSKGSGSPVTSTSSSTPPSTTRSSLPITSSSSAPVLPTPASTAPPAAIVQGPAQQQHSVGSQLRNTGRLARAGVAAATSAAVAAAVLGQDLDVAAATSAAVAAAMLRQESAPAQMQGSGGRAQAGSEDEAVDGGSLKPDRQFWLGQRLAAAAAPPLRAAAAAQRASSAALAAAAPPVRAVVERAGSAARLVAVPLSAAASVPMRAAPQYLPLGQQLYISPAAVGTAEPPATIFEELPEPAAPSAPALTIATAQQKHQQPAPLQPPQQPPQQQRVWPFWGPAPAAATAAVAAAATSRQGTAQGSGLGSALEDDDNVDVAAAAAMSDPEALVAAAAAAESEGPRSGGGGSTSSKKRRRAALFEAHRMATYRNRLLGICHGSLQGRLLMRSLPMLPNLPRPGDVAASELLAPAMFPLRAVGTVNQPLTTTSPVPASGAAAVSASAKPSAKPAAKAAAAKATAAKSAAAKAEKLEKLQARAARRPFWQQLLARAAGQEQQDPPVELLIRVEGKGLANVSQAWIDGVSQPATATAAGKPLAPEAAAKPAMAEVTILQQPQAPLLPPLERPPLPLVSHLLAFVSGLAVTLGWVALLRQLQPAGSGDFLLARVRLPASAVRDAQRAAQNSLLTSVTDGPLLHGLHLGPRLSLRLQSDFAVHSLPLDIRVAADMQQQLSGRRWPWQQHLHAPTPASQPQQPGVQQQQQQEQRAARWWEWPGSSTAAGH